MEHPHILQSQLAQYAAGDLYPLHMPGHKRRLCPAPDLPAAWDMTEVEGVDDLHSAQGILKEAMDRTARLHGAERTWYLVNGSTCGLLAGIRALAPAHSQVLVARNCHKAVYHAIELGNLRAHWLTPPVLSPFGVYGSLSPEAVEEAFQACPEAVCVVLTSPTYEGVLSDIAGIAAVCHAHGAALLVDEAHGAHLGLFPDWPDSAVHLGADLVVQSAHKTLPSLTQTALLHLGKGSRADPEEVERQLGIFETSSPSYPLLASLDGCTGFCTAEGGKAFAAWREALRKFDGIVESLRHFQVLGHGGTAPEIFDFDPSKLPVCTAGTGETGVSLAETLRKRFRFETEMACGNITLAMTSPADTETALCRFGEALRTLDAEHTSCPAQTPILPPPAGRPVCTIGEAVLRPAEAVPLAEAAGRVSAEYVWAYPPGVPLIAPGEQAEPGFPEAVSALLGSGTNLYHSHCKKPGFLWVFA